MTDVGNLSDYVSQMKEALDCLFVSMEKDLKAADASLKRHHTVLKTQDKSLEQVYDLIATLERRVNHCEEQAHVDELRILGLENENFVLRESHDALSDKVLAMEARVTLGAKGYLTSRYIEITLRFFKQCVQQVSGRYMLITITIAVFWPFVSQARRVLTSCGHPSSFDTHPTRTRALARSWTNDRYRCS